MSSSSENDSGALRVAIVGCGRMGRLHAERVLQDGRGRVVALFDSDRSAAESLRSELAHGGTIYEDFDKLVEDGEVDAAIVCTPTEAHYSQALPLVCRGIAVLCEKPLAGTRTEALELIAADHIAGSLLSIAYQRRLLALYRTLQNAVASEAFGPVRAILSHNIENWQQTISGTWRDDPLRNPGGFIGDAGSHKIDAVFFVTGLRPTEVFARTQKCGSHVEVTASISALLAGGVPLTMDFIGHARHFSETLSVQCAEADLLLRDGELWVARGQGWQPLAINGDDSNPVVGFFNFLINDADNFAPPDCALPVYDFTAAVLESSRSGKSVKLGPTGGEAAK